MQEEDATHDSSQPVSECEVDGASEEAGKARRDNDDDALERDALEKAVDDLGLDDDAHLSRYVGALMVSWC